MDDDRDMDDGDDMEQDYSNNVDPNEEFANDSGDGEEEGERENSDQENETDIVDQEEGSRNDQKRIPDDKRITTKYLTKYERARIIGARALQISKNSPIFVELDGTIDDPILIAEKELKAHKIPFIIRRYLPDGSYEEWKLNELEIPEIN